ncbi:DinB family protein [Flaviaesturariibacter amylovorans]|uniref:DinB-like domain-containing protein n=1 Tax=Flaviaesturariibacter amylovorans TaxID=1084520 RepID=A0ABP8GT56_9BACT
MSISKELAAHFRAVHFGGNWTSVNLKDTLEGVSWQQAVTPMPGLNSIAVLVFHMNYYVGAVLRVLRGGALEASDKLSFGPPVITCAADWEALVDRALSEADAFAQAMEQLDDAQLEAPFLDGKYGSWYRNLAGIVEHTHYHLGQVSLLKKMTVLQAGPAAAVQSDS